jgi:hypothetical protein
LTRLSGIVSRIPLSSLANHIIRPHNSSPSGSGFVTAQYIGKDLPYQLSTLKPNGVNYEEVLIFLKL